MLRCRIEFWESSSDELRGVAVREDLTAAAAPRVGERFAPGRLSQDGYELTGLTPLITSIEHFPSTPGVTADAEPLVLAVVRMPWVPKALAAREAMEREGWRFQDFLG